MSKEFLASILSLRYPLALILIVVAALFVTAVRTHVYRKQVSDYRQAVQDWRKTMASVRWPWQSIGIGLSFEKSPEPLAIFAFGLENEMTRSVKFSEFYPDRVGLRKLDPTSFRYFSQIDIVTVIYFGCSLLALLLVFDSVTAAKERGTMRVLLAGPVKRTTVILGKIAAGLLTLSVPLVLAWGVSIMYVLALSGHSFSLDDCFRITGMVLASLLFIGTIFALGLAISCWARSSNASLVLSLLVWLLLVLFLPSAAKGISDKVHPVPSFASVEQDREALQGASKNYKVFDSLRATILKEEPELENDGDRLWQRTFALLAEQALHFQENLENKVRNNVALFGQALRVSPAWSFLSTSTALAGTGAQDYLKYMRDVRLFRPVFQQASENQKQRCVKRSGLTVWASGYGVADNPFVPDLWPSFVFRKLPLNQVGPTVVSDAAWMLGFMVMFLIIAVAGFVRSEI